MYSFIRFGVKHWGKLLVCFIAVTLPVASAAAAPPAGGNWQNILDESFQGTSLNTKLWNTCYLWGHSCTDHGGNGELERYTSRNVVVQNGTMQLVSQSKNVAGIYPSGMINSQDRFSFQYGYIEASLKIPSGQGLWPAFWLLPQDDSQSIEIDIMEVLGQQPQIDYQVDHFNYGNGRDYLAYLSSDDLSQGFHTYGLLWEPNKLVWYLDGLPTYTITNHNAIPDKPMYLILNLAVGGTWPGVPNNSTPFPSSLAAHFIRVWKYIGPAPVASAPPVLSGDKQATKTIVASPVTGTNGRYRSSGSAASAVNQQNNRTTTTRIMIVWFLLIITGAAGIGAGFYYISGKRKKT